MDKRRRSESPVAALDEHIREFKSNNKVPEDLSMHVSASEKRKLIWYKTLSKAWPEASPLPTPEAAAQLLSDTLDEVYPYGFDFAELVGLLNFYGLGEYLTLPEIKPFGEDSRVADDASDFLLVLNTLPVSKDGVKNGCCFSVCVVVKEYYLLPSNILIAFSERDEALANLEMEKADEKLKFLNGEGYDVMDIHGVEVLNKKFEIVLRGLEVLEESREAKDMLMKMVDGKSLMINVSQMDKHMRFVGDVYCDGTLLQEKFEELLTAATCYDHTRGVSEKNMLLEMELGLNEEMVWN